MRVEGISLPVRAVLNALSRTDTSFRLPGTALAGPEAPPQTPGPSLQAATSVQVLIAVAAMNESPQQRRKQEAKRVDKGLGLLERLHDASLGGASEAEVLEALEQWVAEFSMPDNPQLQQLARDVELRVKVELARHDRLV
ncbi:flagellar assembly protein FliX [Stakelama sp. CBK3Z-3]|uniref:Flagellar assembly protein FliX n=1 Tax=Stakelama flava TaxID=2860338 RepID=A0ABS6XJM6_9SPHN|nr:flagellar assembly protein FliX [Stakelama flava]MBW4330413.1 flagellar assembly protein FliX [Stakelama flava]